MKFFRSIPWRRRGVALSLAEEEEEELSEDFLVIALVIDTVNTRGNGTSNSARQYAHALEKLGHEVRIVGVGSEDYPAEIKHIPLVSTVAYCQQIEFAQPSEELFERAFNDVDIVHVYLPFDFERQAARFARLHNIPVSAGFHLQPENVLASMGPIRHLPAIVTIFYRCFWRIVYRHVYHIHVPSQMGRFLLRKNRYSNYIHVISNGYGPEFIPLSLIRLEKKYKELYGNNWRLVIPEELKNRGIDKPSNVRIALKRPFRIVMSGRLAREKNQITLLRAIQYSKYADLISITIAGSGPLENLLKREARQLVPLPAIIGFQPHDQMLELLHEADLFVHTSIADEESISVIEAMASGLVPVCAVSDLSAASQFALCEPSRFPAENPQALAKRIDWWIEHPDQNFQWSQTYAQHTKEHYSVDHCAKKFVTMERQAIRDNNPPKPLRLLRRKYRFTSR